MSNVTDDLEAQAPEVLTETEVLDALSRSFNRLVRVTPVGGLRQTGLQVAMRSARTMADLADVLDELAEDPR